MHRRSRRLMASDQRHRPEPAPRPGRPAKAAVVRDASTEPPRQTRQDAGQRAGQTGRARAPSGRQGRRESRSNGGRIGSRSISRAIRRRGSTPPGAPSCLQQWQVLVERFIGPPWAVTIEPAPARSRMSISRHVPPRPSPDSRRSTRSGSFAFPVPSRRGCRSSRTRI